MSIPIDIKLAGSILSIIYLMFTSSFQAWLCDVERSMRWTLKELLKQCRLALKKNTSKRDKWVKEWAGQVNRSCCKYVDYRFVDAFIYLHVRTVRSKRHSALLCSSLREGSLIS